MIAKFRFTGGQSRPFNSPLFFIICPISSDSHSGYREVSNYSCTVLVIEFEIAMELENAIFLNHSDNKVHPLRKIDSGFFYELAHNVDRKVLFVGEGNFTFTVAFATLRACHRCSIISADKSVWDGIHATRYESVYEMAPEVSLTEAKLKCIESISQIFSQSTPGVHSPGVQHMTLHRIKHIVDLPEIPPSAEWKYGVDATDLCCNLSHTDLMSYAVFWFQCPWSNNPCLLINKFLLSLLSIAEDQNYHVCIGISKQFPFIKGYGLEAILGANLCCLPNSNKILSLYDFCGADDTFIKEILRFGYRHQGNKDIHSQIFSDHVTLVFKRKLNQTL